MKGGLEYVADTVAGCFTQSKEHGSTAAKLNYSAENLVRYKTNCEGRLFFAVSSGNVGSFRLQVVITEITRAREANLKKTTPTQI